MKFIQHRWEPARLSSPRLIGFFTAGCSTANSECVSCCNVYRTIYYLLIIPLAILHGRAASSASGSVLFCAGSTCSVSLNE